MMRRLSPVATTIHSKVHRTTGMRRSIVGKSAGSCPLSRRLRCLTFLAVSIRFCDDTLGFATDLFGRPELCDYFLNVR